MLGNKQGRNGEELEVIVLSWVVRIRFTEVIFELRPEGGEGEALLGTEKKHSCCGNSESKGLKVGMWMVCAAEGRSVYLERVREGAEDEGQKSNHEILLSSKLDGSVGCGEKRAVCISKR